MHRRTAWRGEWYDRAHMKAAATRPRIARKRSRVHGDGVFAVDRINKNTRIIDYAGELIRNSDSEAREERYLAEGCIWVFRVNRRWSRDAAVGGNIARFINHACRPNCWVEIDGTTIWIRASETDPCRRGTDVRLRDRRRADDPVPLPTGVQEQAVTPGGARVLTVNTGSSSLKLALFDVGSNAPATRIASASIDRIADHAAALQGALGQIRTALDAERIDAVSHRIVQGGARYHEPQRITAEVIADLETLAPIDPEHTPQTLAAVAAMTAAFPSSLQVACFDTAFHRSLPRVAQMYALPQRFWDAGVRRYGFHGLSCRVHHAARCADVAPAAAWRTRDHRASRQRREHDRRPATGAASRRRWGCRRPAES